MIVCDKHGNDFEFAGWSVARHDLADVKAGVIYPTGFSVDVDTGNKVTVILDENHEIQTVGFDDVSVYQESYQYVKMKKAYPSHKIKIGDIVASLSNIEGRDINDGCRWVSSGNPTQEWFAASGISFTTVQVAWSKVCYPIRTRLAIESKPSGKSSGILDFLFGGKSFSSLVGKPVTVKLTTVPVSGCANVNSNFVEFTPKHVLTSDRYVKVEFTSGGKAYTYSLPSHMEAAPGDDAVVVVNNQAYPELKGTKVVRVLEVLEYAPAANYAYKPVEHIVSKRSERKNELEAKLKKLTDEHRSLLSKEVKSRNSIKEIEDLLASGNY